MIGTRCAHGMGRSARCKCVQGSGRSGHHEVVLSTAGPSTWGGGVAHEAAGEKLSEESPISDLLGIDPPAGLSDWGYAC